jgi:hypothetical protein
MTRSGTAETDPTEAARRGFWCFVRWTGDEAKAVRTLTAAQWSGIRRTILEYEFAHKPTLAQKLDCERTATAHVMGGFGYEPRVWRSELLAFEPDEAMWPIMRTWPEYDAVATAAKQGLRSEFSSEAASVASRREQARQCLAEYHRKENP